MRNNNRGQVMLEAIVALSILTFAMLGIITVISNSIAANRVSTNQEIGVNLAAEGIEVVKSILDTNSFSPGAWNRGLNGCPPAGPGCSVQYDSVSLGSFPSRTLKFGTVSGTDVYNYSTGLDTIFKRRITIDNFSGNELRVISTVSWIDRNDIPFSVALEDRFFNWR